MADNVAITAGSGTTVSTEQVSTLNGDAVSPQHVQRMLASIRTADGTAIDLPGDDANGLDVDVTRLPALAAGSNNIGRVDVDSLPALPTGTNAIGRVDVGSALPAGSNEIGAVNQAKVSGTAVDVNAGRASAGTQRVILASDQAAVPITDNGGSVTVDGSVSLAAAIPAGTNNIGDVDVLTVPADPFGANADALVAAGAAGSIQAKLRRATQGLEDLKTGVVLAAGTNAIGKLAANSGVDIGDVDVASLPALPAGSNEIGGVNATRIAGTAVDVNSGNKGAGTQRIVIATDQPQLTNPFKVDGSAVTQPVSGNVGLVAQSSGGWSPSKTISASGTNATSVKRAAGHLGSYVLSNNSTGKRYVKFYDKATAPTVGTDTPVHVIELQPGALANVEFTQGVAFASGIAFAITTGIADSDTGAVGANEVIVNVGYK